jgi:hypothetical protein
MIIDTMRIKISKNIIHIVSIVFLIFYLCDRILVSFDKNPVFAIVTNYFKDGGTQCRIGLGYSVVLWHSLSIIENNDTKITGYKIGKEFKNFPQGYLNFYGINLETKKELEFIIDKNCENENFMDIISMNISFALDWFILIIPIIFTMIIIFLIIYYIIVIKKIFKKTINNKGKNYVA